MGTLLLAEAGALKPGGMQYTVTDDWPNELAAQDWTWIGFAQRVRVIAYATDRVQQPPTTMRALIDPQWKGRIGMARPQFGTTRGHMALLCARWGENVFEEWLEGLRDNRVRLYDGNASVVRGIAMGEIDIGLTDTDDVFAGQANGWKVDLVYEATDLAGHTEEGSESMPNLGPTMIPNTVAIIDGGPNPLVAKRLAAFLVSEEAERIIAQSASRNIPVNAELSREFSDPLGLGVEWNPISYAEAHKAIGAAMDACERTLMGP